MSLLYDNRRIRELEGLAIDAGIDEYQLMQRAGQAACQVLQQRWPHANKIIICTGKGKNAGDGYILARLCHELGKSVKVYSLFTLPELSNNVSRAAEEAKEAGVEILPYTADCPFDSEIIVDALLGTGFSGEMREPFGSLINTINEQNQDIFSLDVPSGLNPDTGSIQGAAVDADVTLAFIGLKQGFYTSKGPGRCGEIMVSQLDLPNEIYQKVAPSAQIISWDRVREVLPKRPRDSHKGYYGHVLVIGGDYGMGGAVRMAAEGALRVGAGLVTVATRPEHVPIVSSSRPEIMCHQVAESDELEPLLERATVVVIGPGLGRSPWAEALLFKTLQSPLPKLLDADALNLLSENPQFSNNWVLTPHPGEAAKLLDTSTQELQLDRFSAVQELQNKYGGVIVLKGAGTLVKGNTDVISICHAGNPGMASGGMGDVLSGIIGGFIAQGLDLLTAAEIGVYIHARASDLAVEAGGGERGLLATDVFTYMRQLVNPS